MLEPAVNDCHQAAATATAAAVCFHRQRCCCSCRFRCCCRLQHRALVVKRLHTTVEEDASTKARLGGLSAKLEAAGAEKLQLEHRLKLQRLEQAKAMGTLQVCRG